MKRQLRLLLAFWMILVLAGCGGASGDSGGGAIVGEAPGSGPSPSPLPSPSPAPVLKTLTIDPQVAVTVTGGIETFAAVGRYSDGSERDLTSQVVWSSSDPAVTVSNVPGEHGFATAHAPHAGLSVRAALGGLTASATLSVEPHRLVSIAVSPPTTSLALGTRGRVHAVGVYSDGAHADVTTLATWTSTAPAVATVDGQGGVTGASVGQATLRAAIGDVVGSGAVTVTPATLTALQVTPRIASIATGTSLQYTATGVFTDLSTQDLTEFVTWTSSDPSVSLSPAGLASGRAPADVIVTASMGPLSDSAALTVTPAFLVSILVTPPAGTVALGTDLQMHATGLFSDESAQDLTDAVTWTSSDPSVALVRSGGLTTSSAVGSTNITATLGPVSGQAHLSVSNATLVSIAVTPATSTAARGTSLQLTATGTFTDGSTQDLTDQVTWTSSSPAVQISNSRGTPGLAYAATVAPHVEVAAILDEIRGTASMTVSPAVLVSLAVTPHALTMPKGVSQPLTATGTFSDGTTQDLTAISAWSSSSPAVATVDRQGTVTGTGVGQAFVTAAFGGVADFATVDTTPAALRSIAVSPSTWSLRVSQRTQYQAVGTWSDGIRTDLTRQVVWTTSNPAAAQISNVPDSRGRCEALAAASSVTVRAALGGVHGDASLTVVVAPRILYSVGNTGFLRPFEFAVLTGTGGLLAPMFRTPFNSLQAGNTSAMVTADGRFVYSTTSLGFDFLGFIGGIRVDRTTGTFTELPGFRIETPTTNGALAIAGTPDSRYVYVATYAENTRPKYLIFPYEVSESGALRRTSLPVPCSDRPSAMTIDRQGRFLFVASEGGGTIHVYTLFPDGGLAELRDSPFAMRPEGEGPRKCVVDPSGRHLYFVTHSLVGGARISPTGSLEVIMPFQSYHSPFDIAMHPSGRYFLIKASVLPLSSALATVRVSEGGAYRIASTSAYLDSLQPPHGLAVDPVGDFAYNIEAGEVSQVALGPEGQHEEIAGSPIKVNGGYIAPHTLLVIP